MMRLPVLVSTNYSHFEFSCPVCSGRIAEDDKVWNFRMPGGFMWPMCQACGITTCTGELFVPLGEREVTADDD